MGGKVKVFREIAQATESYHSGLGILVLPFINCQCLAQGSLWISWSSMSPDEIAVVVESFKLCLLLWDPTHCSMPGFPVLHCIPEFAQTHVHWDSDGIQPSHPMSPPSLSAFNLSQHHGLSQWISSSHQVASFEFAQNHVHWVNDTILPITSSATPFFSFHL